MGIVVGIATGLVRFGIQYSFSGPTCEDPTDYRPAIVRDFHYLYFGMFLFCFTLLTTVIVSLLTKPIDKKHVSPARFNLLKLLQLVLYKAAQLGDLGRQNMTKRPKKQKKCILSSNFI